MDTLTVWMLIPTFYPVIGGAQSQVHRLSKILMAHNWSVRVLTRQHSYTHPYGLPASDRIDGTSIIRFYSRGGTKLGSLLYVLGGLWYLLRHSRRSIYHAHDVGASGWLAVLARYLLGGRCLVKLRTGRKAYEQYFSSGLGRWQSLLLLRLADRVVVVNSEVERLVCELGLPPERVARIPNAVDTNQFRPVSAEDKPAVRQHLGLSTEKTLVLYVGRLEHLKGVDILLHAWVRLPEETRHGALLVVVGDGPEREKLLKMSASLRIQNSVLFTGSQQTVRDFYWAADLFVLPSRTEGLSNALVEAMACGLPVIASSVGGALDLIEEDQNGVLFNAEDDVDLAHKLIELIEAKSSWASLRTQARRSVKKYADLTLVLDRFRDLYHDLLDEAG